MNRITSNTNKTAMKTLVKYLTKAKVPYTLSISNYTVKITSNVINATFSKKSRSKRFFAAFCKVKSDVSSFDKPKVNKHDVKYFEHDFRKETYVPEVTNIDLKNAYATVLYNNGYLSNETFAYLSKLPKQDRLGSIGMLASKKYVFDYNDKGELHKFRKVVGELEDFFYYCAKTTQDLMNDLKKICGNKFLFTWVDSIYFKPCVLTEQLILDYIQQAGFGFSKTTLTNFKVLIQPGKVKLEFNKDGDDTYFFIPAKSSEAAESIATYLTEKYYHNESNNTKITKTKRT